MKSIRSFDEKVGNQLQKNYAQIENALQSFQITLEKGKQKCSELKPEIAKQRLGEIARPALHETMKTFEQQVQDVENRFQTTSNIVATKMKGAQPKPADPTTEAVKELTATIKQQQTRAELSGMEVQQRQQIFMDACSRGDEELVEAVTSGLIPILPPKLTDQPVAEMKERKTRAVVGEELNETYQALDKCRAGLRESISQAKKNIREMLNSHGLNDADMVDPAFQKMSVEERAAMVGEIGLDGFKQMVSPL